MAVSAGERARGTGVFEAKELISLDEGSFW